MKKSVERIQIIPHPSKVLVRISKAAWEQLFFKKIIRDDGEEVHLFTRLEEKDGYEQKWAQNVSVGQVMAVGSMVNNVHKDDLAILDYKVTNDPDCLVGMFNGDRMVCIPAITTYHEKNAKRGRNMRRAYRRGDMNVVSPLLGVVRKKELIAFDPYVFLEHKSNVIMLVNAAGLVVEQTEDIVTRKILAAPEDSGYVSGETVMVKEMDLFTRQINDKEISTTEWKDILCKKAT